MRTNQRLRDLALGLNTGELERGFLAPTRARITATNLPVVSKARIPDAAISKLYSGELMEHYGEAMLDILALEANCHWHCGISAKQAV
jgi:hypothetical protein